MREQLNSSGGIYWGPVLGRLARIHSLSRHNQSACLGHQPRSLLDFEAWRWPSLPLPVELLPPVLTRVGVRLDGGLSRGGKPQSRKGSKARVSQSLPYGLLHTEH
ncbi:hypothetical protein Zmor_005417 [Zophobas morio]|uniref:Uncharacterized protein n=1 Tax=Zophobas morio TaxID=2755281 RepID=A0AA38IPM9_9CUCU|nr:hypothetical protein Zmor_005417 [Zophobas morio]